MITVETLIKAGIGPTQARQFAEPLSHSCEQFGLDTPVRQASLLAQCAHESGGFVHLEESLYYRTPERIMQMWPRQVTSIAIAQHLACNPQGLANVVYAARNGNSGAASGDGWRYRGRGLIQLTGRANYGAAAAEVPELKGIVDSPDDLLQPSCAAISAAWFFVARGCKPLADASNTEAITRIVNGPALAGLSDREQWFDQFVRALS